MVDISGSGSDGPIEHGFSNWVFVFPTIITATLVGVNVPVQGLLVATWNLSCYEVLVCFMEIVVQHVVV
ncbi:uncharacterized protein LOC143237683 [Tachypleus tridentatus]|uniref:uncharacterized protein LOC143237683 n=1 Tax=Tachypleus tridentatus TaxID=6853 RepID=UPI003FD332BA